MKLPTGQKIWLGILIAANLALWLIPSSVVEQIARDRHTMLGRYSRQHFTWIIVVGLFSLVSFYVDGATGRNRRRRRFQVWATLLFLIPTLGVIDYLVRSPGYGHYIRDTLAYHHPPDATYQQAYEDKPKAHRTYPDPPPGYPSVACALHTDARGFRNRADLDRADVVVLGDSFAEGSGVSDEHVWPVRLAQRGGLSVYNLGMSGYDPLHYLASLEEHGLGLGPRYVLCLLYEGNDFRSARSDWKRRRPDLSSRLTRYFKQSPILNALDDLLIRTFGPLNCKGPVPGIEILDWLPLAIPDGPDAKYYAFAPKQLRDLYERHEAFAIDRHWLNPRAQLAEMHKICKQNGAVFIVLYAPLKAHVLLPAVADRIPADKVRGFLALRYKDELAAPDVFLANLVQRSDGREAVVRDWCGRESIPFLALTEALRQAAIEGTQVYYTYDPHWTPNGHRVVADAVDRYLGANFLARASDATGPPQTPGAP